MIRLVSMAEVADAAEFLLVNAGAKSKPTHGQTFRRRMTATLTPAHNDAVAILRQSLTLRAGCRIASQGRSSRDVATQPGRSPSRGASMSMMSVSARAVRDLAEQARDASDCVFVGAWWYAVSDRGLGDPRGRLIPGRVGLSAG